MSTLFGGGGQTKQQQQLTTAETGLVGQQTQAAQFGESTAQSLIPQGTAITNSAVSSLGPVLQYFQQLMSGNPEQTAQAESSNIQSISKQYEAARKSTDTFSPRGGGSTAANEESRFQQASDTANQLIGAKAQGTQGVSSISQLLAALGGQISGTGLSALAGGTAAAGTAGSVASSANNLLQDSQQNQQAQQAQAGQAIGTLVALLAA